MVCKACWEEAAPEMQETLKDAEPGKRCQQFGCWKWRCPHGDMCSSHTGTLASELNVSTRTLAFAQALSEPERRLLERCCERQRSRTPRPLSRQWLQTLTEPEPSRRLRSPRRSRTPRLGLRHMVRLRTLTTQELRIHTVTCLAHRVTDRST